MHDTFSLSDSSPQPLAPEDPLYARLQGLATAALAQALGQPVEVAVGRLDTLRHWAFLTGRMQSPSGDAIAWQDTPYAELAGHGAVSDVYVALFKRDDADEWLLIEQSIGPTDMAWLTWPGDFGAPTNLLQ